MGAAWKRKRLAREAVEVVLGACVRDRGLGCGRRWLGGGGLGGGLLRRGGLRGRRGRRRRIRPSYEWKWSALCSNMFSSLLCSEVGVWACMGMGDELPIYALGAMIFRFERRRDVRINPEWPTSSRTSSLGRSPCPAQRLAS